MPTYTENNVNYSYTVGNSNASVTSSPNATGDIVFLDQFTVSDVTYNVTSIGVHAFSNRVNLTSVVIPSSVTSIKTNAFNGCSGLTSVVIPSSVTSIEDLAFIGCSGLTSITIPSSVTSITNFAFQNCVGLTSIIVNTYLANFQYVFYTINNINNPGLKITFDYIGAIPDGACAGMPKTNEVTIGDKITSIGVQAFQGCSKLTSITLPSSVTSIKTNAFNGCSGLTSVVIPSSVTSIEDLAFQSCSGLTSVTIPSSVTIMGNGVFASCTGLKNLIINTYLSNFGSVRNGLNNKGLEITFDYTGEIPVNACNSLTEISGVTIGPKITSIGASAFQNCSGLTSITIPASVTSIGDSAFQNCSGLTSVTIPSRLTSAVTTIGNYAFSGCTSLTNIFVNTYLANFGLGFFGLNNDNLQITFDYDGEIPVGACNGRTKMTSVTIGPKIISIGASAFKSCASLTSVTIPSDVTSIGDAAFAECSGLTSIIISASVNIINNSAFDWCSSLKSVFFLGDIPDIKNLTFTASDDTAYCVTGAENKSRLTPMFSRVTELSVLEMNTLFPYLKLIPAISTVSHSRDSTNIHFTQNIDLPVTSYSYSTDNGLTYTNTTVTTTPLQITGLKPRTNYKIIIKANKESYSVESKMFEFTYYIKVGKTPQ